MAATPEGRSHSEKRLNCARVREFLRPEAGIDLSAAEVDRFVALAREQHSLDELSEAMARIPDPVSPAIARAAQATENSVKTIEDEAGLLTSAQVAQLLGSRSMTPAARWLANDMRGRGELLAVRRLNKHFYLGFQFDRLLGRVKFLVSKLLQLGDANGWEPEDVVLWLVSPTTYFAYGSRPVDHIDNDPALVLDIAQRAWAVQW